MRPLALPVPAHIAQRAVQVLERVSRVEPEGEDVRRSQLGLPRVLVVDEMVKAHAVRLLALGTQFVPKGPERPVHL